ncbi:MAG: hypothetical protein ACI9OO_000219 [Bacteroidia bacterium]|jgi:hypothetical protein
MVEFLIVLPVLYLLIFGTIQMGLLYSAKSTLNYAAFEAARMGALRNADYHGIRKGLIRGMGPLFTHGDSEEAILAGFETAEAEVDDYMLITRVNPVQADFVGAHSTVPPTNTSGRAILNDNLMYRSTEQVGGISIQDANLLKVRVEYCHRLVVPVISSMLTVLKKSTAGGQAKLKGLDGEVLPEASRKSYKGDYSKLCADRAGNRGFVLSAEAIVRMQSPAHETCHKNMTCLKIRI